MKTVTLNECHLAPVKGEKNTYVAVKEDKTCPVIEQALMIDGKQPYAIVVGRKADAFTARLRKIEGEWCLDNGMLGAIGNIRPNLDLVSWDVVRGTKVATLCTISEENGVVTLTDTGEPYPLAPDYRAGLDD